MKKLLILVLTHLIFISSLRAEEKMYVQSVKAQVRDSAAMTGKVVVELGRGDEVSVLEKKDLWYQVQVKGQKGFVNRLMLNSYKPIGKAELENQVSDSLEKSSRKRSSAYAVSASTRGLSSNDRVRGNREQYQADPEAVRKMEALEIKGAELDNFRKSAKLSE